MLIGYSRVSTSDQNPQLQQDALAAAGCGECFTDTSAAPNVRGPVYEQRSVPVEQAIHLWCGSLIGLDDIFASLAEFERDLIRERTTAGLAAARARGRKGGRPKGVDEKKRKAALALKRDPNYSVKEICDSVGISRNTYYKYTRE